MAILERILVFTISIFCSWSFSFPPPLIPLPSPTNFPLTNQGPPLSVLLVAGPGTDCLINVLLFIAGVIPGHIHAFYVTCTYFHRKHRVKRGRYPGGRKAGICSERVWNGGVGRGRVDELWREEEGLEEKQGAKRSGGRAQMVVEEDVFGREKKWLRR
ncbi:uncharacterized protein RAG0_00317 [Rhynchosporium agropyri]|uniref:Uncharacterized protein n=1 Tax=Rhynchosporium agropyri TaxID=914238 RepID=A0A1E1JS32_9HELO|nr:uncharacterized protein RAG0_00317 [Rhynchosporium agropyri]